MVVSRPGEPMIPALRKLRGTLAALALAANTLVHVPLMVPFAALKCASRGRLRRGMDTALNAIARSWIRCNRAWMPRALSPACELAALEALDPRGWYVVVSNHRGWADIFVLQHALAGHIPLLKFFLKRELIYVPLAGFAWWALDVPFLRRSGGARGARRDLQAARASCERFRQLPTSVLNFVEGTRYSAAKAAEQGSPYRHLLKPKVAGLAAALAALRARGATPLDVTLVYPGGTPTFWALLCGEVEGVVVHVRAVALPEPAPEDERQLRVAVDAWLQAMWREKDVLIERVLAQSRACA